MASDEDDGSGSAPAGYVKEEDEWEVETIVGKRKSKGGKVEYRVKWVGWDEADNTWEPEAHLDNARALIEAYDRALAATPTAGPKAPRARVAKPRAKSAAALDGPAPAARSAEVASAAAPGAALSAARPAAAAPPRAGIILAVPPREPDPARPAEQAAAADPTAPESSEPLLVQREWGVEAIRDSRRPLGGSSVEYLVKWRGRAEASSTWEPAANLRTSTALIDAFEASRNAAAAPPADDAAPGGSAADARPAAKRARPAPARAAASLEASAAPVQPIVTAASAAMDIVAGAGLQDARQPIACESPALWLPASTVAPSPPATALWLPASTVAPSPPATALWLPASTVAPSPPATALWLPASTVAPSPPAARQGAAACSAEARGVAEAGDGAASGATAAAVPAPAPAAGPAVTGLCEKTAGCSRPEQHAGKCRLPPLAPGEPRPELCQKTAGCSRTFRHIGKCKLPKPPNVRSEPKPRRRRAAIDLAPVLAGGASDADDADADDASDGGRDGGEASSEDERGADGADDDEEEDEEDDDDDDFELDDDDDDDDDDGDDGGEGGDAARSRPPPAFASWRPPTAALELAALRAPDDWRSACALGDAGPAADAARTADPVDARRLPFAYYEHVRSRAPGDGAEPASGAAAAAGGRLVRAADGAGPVCLEPLRARALRTPAGRPAGVALHVGRAVLSIAWAPGGGGTRRAASAGARVATGAAAAATALAPPRPSEYLAISTLGDARARTQLVREPRGGAHAIQIWALEPEADATVTGGARACASSRLELCLVQAGGCARELAWCPRGASAALGRLGILAAALGSGYVALFAVPLPSAVREALGGGGARHDGDGGCLALALPPCVTVKPPSSFALRLSWWRGKASGDGGGGGRGGHLLAVGCSDGTVCVWDANRMHAESAATSAAIASEEAKGSAPTAAASGAAAAPPGARSAAPPTSMPPPSVTLLGHCAPVRAVSWSPARHLGGAPALLASADDQGQILIWDVREPWQPIFTQAKRGPGVLSIAWARSARGARLFVSSDASQQASEFIEVRGRNVLRALTLPGYPPAGLAFAQAVCARTGRLARAWTNGTVDILVENQVARTTRVTRGRVDVLVASALATTQGADATAGGAPRRVCVLAANAPPSSKADQAATAALAGCLHGLLTFQTVCWSPNARSVGFLACGGECAVVHCLKPSSQTGQLRAVFLRGHRTGKGAEGGRPRGRPRGSGGTQRAAKKRRAADSSEEEDDDDDDDDESTECSGSSTGSDDGSDDGSESASAGSSDHPG